MIETAVRTYDTIHDILSVSHNLFTKTELRHFGASGTEELKPERIGLNEFCHFGVALKCRALVHTLITCRVKRN